MHKCKKEALEYFLCNQIMHYSSIIESFLYILEYSLKSIKVRSDRKILSDALTFPRMERDILIQTTPKFYPPCKEGKCYIANIKSNEI